MRVKSLLLSMCAIAALAGCSQNDDEITGVSNAPEAKVILKLAGTGDQASSRAAGIPGDLDAKNGAVSDLTVFIFNNAGTVITKRYLGSPATGANPISTTTDAHEVAVVANTGDQTGSGKLFATVASKDALKAVVANMLTAPDNIAGGVTQTDGNLYMSGLETLGAFTDDGNGGQKVDVTVPLHFLSARLSLTEISYNGKVTGTTDNVYAQAGDFATDQNADFTITRVYLMNVQRATCFLPGTDGGSDYIAAGLKQFTGGVAWGTPWDGQAPNEFKPNNEYAIEAAADKFQATSNKISDIGHWYTFANTGVSDIADHPTALVVEVQWRKVKAEPTAQPPVTEELQTLYFTTYFGGGDQEELKAGHSYSVKLELNGNFKPTNQGGSGGGGTTDPTKPTVNSSVNVTVTPASWTVIPEITKKWE